MTYGVKLGLPSVSCLCYFVDQLLRFEKGIHEITRSISTEIHRNVQEHLWRCSPGLNVSDWVLDLASFRNSAVSPEDSGSAIWSCFVSSKADREIAKN
jgi:hypothetical protein